MPGAHSGRPDHAVGVALGVPAPAAGPALVALAAAMFIQAVP